ncbi:Oidioi.mRNA.OKI2018_I69.YSR.g17178.t1.cds [Oikopleura dioica]|uniref:Oidioi.mRNA.OKI2018_I69.YSR.g17178.t1.cds n=1 Tax=Oikopleura dioica TaxID=34765 RepID=A0ABN7SK54_OIKDI|nr:Oidioi.mRNA.OKI2018_I69.YSR.g17178.t1.cds [Oikopleura dioica]
MVSSRDNCPCCHQAFQPPYRAEAPHILCPKCAVSSIFQPYGVVYVLCREPETQAPTAGLTDSAAREAADTPANHDRVETADDPPTSTTETDLQMSCDPPSPAAPAEVSLSPANPSASDAEFELFLSDRPGLFPVETTRGTIRNDNPRSLVVAGVAPFVPNNAVDVAASRPDDTDDESLFEIPSRPPRTPRRTAVPSRLRGRGRGIVSFPYREPRSSEESGF